MKVLASGPATYLQPETPAGGHLRLKHVVRRRWSEPNAATNTFPTAVFRTFKERVLDWEPRDAPPVSRTHERDEFRDLVADAVRRLPPSVIRELVTILDSLERSVDNELWGLDPELSEVVSALVWHERARAARQASASAHAQTVDDAASQANLTPEQILELCESGNLSCLRIEGDVLLPDWQFNDDGALLPEIGSVLKAFPGSASALADWMNRDHPELGEAPRSALQKGRVDEVVLAARSGDGIA